MADGEVGEIVGARHGVVHERACHELTRLAVIHAVLHQRLADALNQTTVHLAFDNHRVDDGAKVIHGRETVYTNLASGRIDFDLANVGTGREGEVGRVIERGLVETWLQLVQWVVVRHIGRQSHLTKSHHFVGALDLELTTGEVHIGIAGFHQVSRNFLGLGFNFVQRTHDGCTAHRDGARAVSAHAERNTAGVAVHDVDLVGREAQACGHHLCKRGFVALAVAV